jgi:phosphohistidine swiveling domain-containing protein
VENLIVQSTEATDTAKVGGKASALNALIKHGLRVPDFFVVASEAFGDDALKPEAKAPLAAALKNFGTKPLAVRSSGHEEDGSTNSHAGQFLSLLNIDPAKVEDAALQVWLSGKTDSLRRYRAGRNLDPDGGALSVIVQRMIDAKIAGVAFTANPVDGRRDRLVISAVAGLGDRLVGGEVDGDDYVVDRVTGTVLEQPASGVLTPQHIKALTDLAQALEAARGRPQDFEWAFEPAPEGDQLYLLQSRPITTALRPLPHPDQNLTIFDNSNIVESYPGLVSPLTYSFAQLVYARVYRTFVALLGVSSDTIRVHGAVFENMLGRVDGRVYYNLINWYRALALLPGFSINRGNMETMMGVDEPLPADIASAIGPRRAAGWGLIGEYLRIGKVVVGLAREAIGLRATIDAFYKRLDSALANNPEQISAMSLTELAGEYRRIESGLLEKWDAPLVNDFLCMIAFGLSHKLMAKWGGREGIELHNDVMIGQGDIVSAEPAQMIAKMGAMAASMPDLLDAMSKGRCDGFAKHPELERAYRAYLAKFSDRCTEELKLESITLDQDPTQLLSAIAAAARSRATPRRDISKPTSLDALFAGKPFKRITMKYLMATAKARVRDRENLRFERTRIFGHARRVFVAIGAQYHALGILAQPRDVFYLTVEEVLGGIEGYGSTADIAGLAALRKAEMQRAAALPDPPQRISFIGAIAARNTTRTTLPVKADNTDRTRTATGCCAGTVTARARIIRDPRTETIELGDILVARHTDPGWIAVFTNASAIVVERGSLLSHSAIVARELGIPCVVGLRNAMDWIKTGETIEVDGGLGKVSKIDG